MLLVGDGATPQPQSPITSTHAPCWGRSYPTTSVTNHLQARSLLGTELPQSCKERTTALNPAVLQDCCLALHELLHFLLAHGFQLCSALGVLVRQRNKESQDVVSKLLLHTRDTNDSMSSAPGWEVYCQASDFPIACFLNYVSKAAATQCGHSSRGSFLRAAQAQGA